jgi:hypothetical protein
MDEDSIAAGNISAGKWTASTLGQDTATGEDSNVTGVRLMEAKAG